MTANSDDNIPEESLLISLPFRALHQILLRIKQLEQQIVQIELSTNSNNNIVDAGIIESSSYSLKVSDKSIIINISPEYILSLLSRIKNVENKNNRLPLFDDNTHCIVLYRSNKDISNATRSGKIFAVALMKEIKFDEANKIKKSDCVFKSAVVGNKIKSFTNWWEIVDLVQLLQPIKHLPFQSGYIYVTDDIKQQIGTQILSLSSKSLLVKILKAWTSNI